MTLQILCKSHDVAGLQALLGIPEFLFCISAVSPSRGNLLLYIYIAFNIVISWVWQRQQDVCNHTRHNNKYFATYIVSFLLFHCLNIFLIFGNSKLQFISVILCISFVLNPMPNNTKVFVHSNLSFSLLIILLSPLTPSCTTFLSSIFTLNPETEWNIFRVSSALFRLFDSCFSSRVLFLSSSYSP